MSSTWIHRLPGRSVRCQYHSLRHCKLLFFLFHFLLDSSSCVDFKASGPLPRIDLKVIHVESQRKIYLGFSDNVNQRELLLIQLEWISSSSFISVWMTRDQNGTSVFHCKVTEFFAECNEVIEPKE